MSIAQLAVLALPLAGLYAISATGLVVVYSTTGIFNIAHGAVGMICAFVYWELSVRRGIPAPVALFLVVVVVAPLLGVLFSRVLMRRLMHAPLITQLLGTVAVTALLLGGAALIWAPSDGYPISDLGGNGGIRVADIHLSWHRVITIATAVAMALGLHFGLAATRLGVAMRAVVDDRDLASLYGIRPRRVCDAAWIIGTVCAALAGVLIAPDVGNMSAETLTFFVISAFAAAVFGRLRSLPMTYVGACVLGLVVTVTPTFLDLTGRWMSLRALLPAIALFVVLLVLPQADLGPGRPVRRYPVESVPSVRSTFVGGAALLALVTAAALAFSAVDVSRLTAGVLVGLVLLGMVPLLGWAGLPFLAPYALAGVGAWVTWKLGGSIPALLAAGAVSAAAGAVVALPALRLRQLYLALSSIALGLIAVSFVFVQPEAFAVPRQLDRLVVAGIDLSRPRWFTVYASAVYVLLAIALLGIRRSRFGRRMVALRDSEVATTCLGVRPATVKILAFTVAGAVSGIGGGVLAQGQRFVSADQFSMITGLSIILSLSIWGIGTVSGPILAGLTGALTTALSQDWAPGGITRALELLGPALAVLMMSQNPRGQVPVIVRHARQEPWAPVSAAIGLLLTVALCHVTGVPGEIALVLSITGAFVAGSLYRMRIRPKTIDSTDWRLGVTEPITPDHVREWDRALGLRA
jgi:branched-chain amino acid transport system permease protein